MATGIFAAANHNSHWIASVAVPSEYRQNTQVYKKKQHPHARTFKQHRGETHNGDGEQGNGQHTHTAAITHTTFRLSESMRGTEYSHENNVQCSRWLK